MTELTKIVIPVAGLGTRVLPASKVIPKEMLTVVDKPIIQYVIEEAVDAGFTDIILVTRPGKKSIERHFQPHAELEAALEAKGKTALLESVRDILPGAVRVHTAFQDKPLGLGHAVLCAADLVGDPAALDISLHVNDALRQFGHTRDMIFSVADLVAYASSIFTLEPGDLIYTGTPEGVGSVSAGDDLVARVSGLEPLQVGVI